METWALSRSLQGTCHSIWEGVQLIGRREIKQQSPRAEKETNGLMDNSVPITTDSFKT